MFDKKLLADIEKYIEENYVEELKEMGHYARFSKCLCDESISVCLESKRKLSDLDELLETSWQEMVFRWIDFKGLKDSDVYKKGNISKQTFSKIRSNVDYQPNKDTAIQMCFGLELCIDDSLDLIGKAGFNLSNSIKRDIVVRYFIENEMYNVDSLNMALDEFGMKLFPIN
jgi:hypothetical protein